MRWCCATSHPQSMKTSNPNAFALAKKMVSGAASFIFSGRMGDHSPNDSLVCRNISTTLRLTTQLEKLVVYIFSSPAEGGLSETSRMSDSSL